MQLQTEAAISLFSLSPCQNLLLRMQCDTQKINLFMYLLLVFFLLTLYYKASYKIMVLQNNNLQ